MSKTKYTVTIQTRGQGISYVTGCTMCVHENTEQETILDATGAEVARWDVRMGWTLPGGSTEAQVTLQAE